MKKRKIKVLQQLQLGVQKQLISRPFDHSGSVFGQRQHGYPNRSRSTRAVGHDESESPVTVSQNTQFPLTATEPALDLITRVAAACRHILLNGHYTFQSGGKMTDLDTLVAGLDFG